MNIVFGKFLSYDKLESLLKANGITVESLVSGAKDRLDRLVSDADTAQDKLADLMLAVNVINDDIDAMNKEKKNIQDALRSLSNDPEL